MCHVRITITQREQTDVLVAFEMPQFKRSFHGFLQSNRLASCVNVWPRARLTRWAVTRPQALSPLTDVDRKRAAEDCRTPKASPLRGSFEPRDSVLDCGSPL